MKKFLAVLLACAALFTLAACGKTGEKEPEVVEPAAPEVTAASPEEIINTVWNGLDEDKKFPAMGGNPEEMNEDGAAAFDMSDAESVLSFLHISEETSAMTDGAASLIHAMNANTFTSAAFHLAEGQDMDAFVSAVKEDVLSTQWICGFPDTLVIFTLGDYAVYFLGDDEIVSNFKAGMETAFGGAAVLAAEETA